MRIIGFLFLLFYFYSALAAEECDVFLNPERCLGEKVALLDAQKFSQVDRSGIRLYVSDPNKNDLGLMVWVTPSEGRIKKIRYAHTTARSIMPLHEFKSLQSKIRKRGTDGRWREVKTRDGEASVFESSELKIMLSRYSITFEFP